MHWAGGGGRLDHDTHNNMQTAPEEQHSQRPDSLQPLHRSGTRHWMGNTVLGSICNIEHSTVSQTQAVRAWLGTSAKKDSEPCCSPRSAYKLEKKKRFDVRIVCSDRQEIGLERTTLGNHLQCAGNKKERIFQILFKRRQTWRLLFTLTLAVSASLSLLPQHGTLEVVRSMSANTFSSIHLCGTSLL